MNISTTSNPDVNMQPGYQLVQLLPTGGVSNTAEGGYGGSRGSSSGSGSGGGSSTQFSQLIALGGGSPPSAGGSGGSGSSYPAQATAQHHQLVQLLPASAGGSSTSMPQFMQVVPSGGQGGGHQFVQLISPGSSGSGSGSGGTPPGGSYTFAPVAGGMPMYQHQQFAYAPAPQQQQQQQQQQFQYQYQQQPQPHHHHHHHHHHHRGGHNQQHYAHHQQQVSSPYAQHQHQHQHLQHHHHHVHHHQRHAPPSGPLPGTLPPRPGGVDVIDPALCIGKITLPRSKVFPTLGLHYWDGGTCRRDLSVCCLFQQGRCHAAEHCHQIHAERDYIAELRRTNSSPECCPHCTGTSGPEAVKWLDGVSGLQVDFDGKIFNIPKDRLLYTQGAADHVRHHIRIHRSQMRVQQQQQQQQQQQSQSPDQQRSLLAAPTDENGGASTSSHPALGGSTTSTGSDGAQYGPAGTLNVTSMCKLFLRNKCRYAKDCKWFHICPKFLGVDNENTEDMYSHRGGQQSSPAAAMTHHHQHQHQQQHHVQVHHHQQQMQQHQMQHHASTAAWINASSPSSAPVGVQPVVAPTANASS